MTQFDYNGHRVMIQKERNTQNYKITIQNIATSKILRDFPFQEYSVRGVRGARSFARDYIRQLPSESIESNSVKGEKTPNH